jgi:DNA-binding HxlR family transcriptional regulator
MSALEATATEICEATPEQAAMLREMLTRIADKWTLLVIEALEREEDTRFTRLQERVAGISQKMLTKTLRQLERDGLVTRRVHATVPPQVDYRLTEMGEALSYAVCGLWIWVGKHIAEVDRARLRYDAKGEVTPGASSV